MRVTRVVREENLMSDWLSELRWEGESLAHTDEGRMARVIRELVKVARMGQGLIWLIGAVGGANSLDKIGPDRAKLELLLDSLSPDAKELLNQ